MEHEKDPGWQFLRITREQMIQEQSVPYDSKKVDFIGLLLISLFFVELLGHR